MMASMGSFIAETDTVLLGRVAYAEWAPYWPASTDEPFASFINQTPKYSVTQKIAMVKRLRSCTKPMTRLGKARTR